MTGTVSYDQQLDQALGPFKHLQVIMAGGVFSAGKLPVYFDYNVPVTKELLFGLISRLEPAGAGVVASVSDMGGSNVGLWRQLGIGHEGESSFVTLQTLPGNNLLLQTRGQRDRRLLSFFSFQV